MNKKRKFAIILSVLISSTAFFGCSQNPDDSKKQNTQFSYNIIKKEGNLTKEEKITNDLNEILNSARGYITAWDTCDTDFMQIIFNNTINGNMSKMDYIKTYRKNQQRMVMKRYITEISVLSYSNNIAVVKINDELKNSTLFSVYKNKAEEITLTYTNENNKWLISKVETVVK